MLIFEVNLIYLEAFLKIKELHFDYSNVTLSCHLLCLGYKQDHLGNLIQQ